MRLALLALLAALPLLSGGWLWLRHSSLAAVQRVRISGVHGADAAQIKAALNGAARHMSTLDVQRGALLAAVAQFPVVRDLRVSASFPHGLRIRVIEQPPVAILQTGGIRTAVAADGVVLGESQLHGGSLPSISAGGVAPLPGGRVPGAATRAELSVLGAVPETLLGWVQRVFMGSEGLTVVMRDGLEIDFGNATRAHAKWIAAARVLADPSSAGATYIDVRLPERPAAGTSAGGTLGGASTTQTQVSASDPSAAALAATLDEAVAGGAGASAPAVTPGTPSTTEPAASEASAGEPAAAAQSESASTSTGTEAASGTGTVAPAGTEAPASATESTSTEASSSTSG